MEILSSFLSGLVLPGLFLGIVVTCVGIITMVRKGLPWERKRKSPFTRQFLRSPGYSLLNQLDELRIDLFGYMLGISALPLMLVATFFVQKEITGKPFTITTITILVVAIIGILVVLIPKLVRTTRKLERIRLGYEAELSVGQELNQLMTRGFRVYHDFPADNFNIDHIVIGKTGVFAVETKGRSKPDTGDGHADATAVYDGKTIAFPHWNETKPIEQARRQSNSLSKWLSSAVGEPVNVIPVLAIPGWYIDYKGKSDVLVYFGKSPEALFTKYCNGVTLTDQMVQRIAHQIESKCRDIDSKTHMTDKT